MRPFPSLEFRIITVVISTIFVLIMWAAEKFLFEYKILQYVWKFFNVGKLYLPRNLRKAEPRFLAIERSFESDLFSFQEKIRMDSESIIV
ncbi:hypothetical protein GJ496_004200 [Pomphorhynchus laevis]|nr:hypothetical protein GJ496_004200 [Pomphorhynchus laevis]